MNPRLRLGQTLFVVTGEAIVKGRFISIDWEERCVCIEVEGKVVFAGSEAVHSVLESAELHVPNRRPR